MGFVLADPGLGQRADDAAGGAARKRKRSRRGEPARGYNRAQARDRQHPETGEQAGGAADRGANSGPGAGALDAVVDSIGIAVDAAGATAVLAVPALGIVGDDADVVMRDAGALQFRHRPRGVAVVVIQA